MKWATRGNKKEKKLIFFAKTYKAFPLNHIHGEMQHFFILGMWKVGCFVIHTVRNRPLPPAPSPETTTKVFYIGVDGRAVAASLHPPATAISPSPTPAKKIPREIYILLVSSEERKGYMWKTFFFFFPLTFVVLVERELEVGHAFEFLFTPAKKRKREIIVSCSVFLFSFARSYSQLSCGKGKEEREGIDPWTDKEQPAIFLFFPFLLKTGVRLNHS